MASSFLADQTFAHRAEAEVWFNAWLADTVALWLDKGLDRARGGFHEHLTHDTLTCGAEFRRLRVVTRQIYSFSAALRHGYDDAREGLMFGLAFLLDRARHPEGGFASRLDLEGRIIDDTRDLYDLAFVLFALAHGYQATGDAALLDEARSLADFIETQMPHPAGGFLESLPPRQPRRQNPHMHLLEASLAWMPHDTTGRFHSLCNRLIALVVPHFYDPEHGYLREYLDDDLRPLDTPRGRIWEPGHHWEWVWLLETAQASGIDVPNTLSPALAHKARSQGMALATTRLCWGEVSDCGTVQEPVSRIWVQGEWLKAETVIPGPDQDTRVCVAASALRRYLLTSTRGLWFERISAQTGESVPEPAPATSLYHIIMAIDALAARETV